MNEDRVEPKQVIEEVLVHLADADPALGLLASEYSWVASSVVHALREEGWLLTLEEP